MKSKKSLLLMMIDSFIGSYEYCKMIICEIITNFSCCWLFQGCSLGIFSSSSGVYGQGGRSCAINQPIP